MKKIFLHLLLLSFITIPIDLVAQDTKVWIKSSVIVPGNPMTQTSPQAFFELESQNFTGNAIPMGKPRPLLRISNFYDLGNNVVQPPKKDILLFMNGRGHLGLNTDAPSSLLNLNNSNISNRQLLTFSYMDNSNKKWDYSSFGIEKSATYWVNNAKLVNDNKWFIDRGSFNASASMIQYGWDGIYFKQYNHNSNTQGAPSHDWKPFMDDWKLSMQITKNGQVRIGDQTLVNGPHMNSKLTVNGKAVFKEAVVTIDSWADYVFDKNYKLIPLSEVDVFVKANKRLPDFPSEEEIVKEGLNVGNIMNKQQEKIEELYLHIIRQEKELQVMKTQIIDFQKSKK